MTFNITALLKRGREMDREEYQKLEVAKLGNLRAGNSGIMAETGDIAASCHRKTLLRSLGIEIDPPDDSKQIMFQLGYASEDLCVSDLKPTLPEGHTILQEADIPIDWTTKNGVRVTGRPDIVICEAGVPKLGLELKSVHSVWSARGVLFGGQPKLSNVAQAAHYMWKLDIPYKLIYKSYSQLGQGMSWAPRMAAMFPAQGTPGSEFMDYNEKGMPLQVKQFELVYDLEVDKHGRVKFRRESTDTSGRTLEPGKWEHSLVTTGDIERYYEYVSEMVAKKQLGSRPMNVDLMGNKESFDMCNAKYCPLSGTCDKYEGDFDKWLSAVKKLEGK